MGTISNDKEDTVIIGTVILVTFAKAESEVKLSYRSNEPGRETENITHQGRHGTNRACTQTEHAHNRACTQSECAHSLCCINEP